MTDVYATVLAFLIEQSQIFHEWQLRTRKTLVKEFGRYTNDRR